MNEFDASFTPTDAYDHIYDYLDTDVVGLTKATGYAPPTWIFDPKIETDGDCTGGGMFVPTSGSPGTKHIHDIPDGGNTWRADCKSVYQYAGIYFSIIAKFKYQKSAGSIFFGTKTDMFILNNGGYPSYCTFQPKNKSQQWPSIPYQNYSNRVYDNSIEWRPYSGMRKLIVRDLDIWFSYADFCTNSSGVHVRTFGAS